MRQREHNREEREIFIFLSSAKQENQGYATLIDFINQERQENEKLWYQIREFLLSLSFAGCNFYVLTSGSKFMVIDKNLDK